MKEHEDDAIVSVKESSVTVDSATDEGIGTVKSGGGGEGEVEGFSGERDEGEDVVVDVVGADVVVAGDGVVAGGGSGGEPGSDEVAKGSLGNQTENDVGMDVVGGDAPVESRVGVVGNEEGLRRVEEAERGVAEEIVERPTESVQEAADGDCVTDEKTGKATEVLDSLKTLEPLTTIGNRGTEEVDMVAVEDAALTVKDEAQDRVSVDPNLLVRSDKNPLTDVVNEGTGEGEGDGVTTTDAQKSGNGTGVGVSKMDVESSRGEPQSSGEEVGVIDSEETGGLTKESVREVADGDCVTDRKTVEEAEVLDSSKIPVSSTTAASFASQEVNMVVEEEGLASKNESQDGVSVDPSLVRPDNQCLSAEVIEAGHGECAAHVHAESSLPRAEVDPMSIEEGSNPATLVETNDRQKSSDGTGVEDSKIAFELASKELQSGRGETLVLGKEEETDNQCLSTEVIKAECSHPQAEVVPMSIEEGSNPCTRVETDDVHHLGLGDSKIPVVLSSKEPQFVGGETSVLGKEEETDNKCLSTEVIEAELGEGAAYVHAESSHPQAEVEPMSIEESSNPAVGVETHDVQKSGGGTGVEDSKIVVELSSKEPQSVGGETSILDEKKEIDNQRLIEAGPGESAAHVHAQQAEVDPMSIEEGLDPAAGVQTNDVQKSSDGTGVEDSIIAVELLRKEPESVGGETSVLDKEEETDNQHLPTEVIEAGRGEGAAHVHPQQAEADPVNIEESLHPAIEVITNVVQRSGDSKTEPQSVGGETSVSDKEEAKGKGLTEEMVEKHTESVHDTAMDEKTEKTDEVRDSSKLQESLATVVNLSSEDVDMVVVEEGLAAQDEAQGSVHVGPSPVCPENRSTSDEVVNAGPLLQQIEQRVTSQSTMEASSERRSSVSGGDDGESTKASAPSVSSVSHSEAAPTVDAKVSDLETRENISVGGEASTIDDNKVCNPGENTDDVKAEDSSKATVAAFTEADEGAKTAVRDISDQFLPKSGDEVASGHIKAPSSTVEVPKTDEISNFQVSAEDFEDADHGVPPADLEFSYEEANVERGEDAGVDIDEVLGWKDEIPVIDDLGVDQGLPRSSREPEEPKLREPIVYERRVHVEVPVDGGRSSPRVKDEDLNVETPSGKNPDDISVQKEQNLVLQSINPPSVNETVKEEPSTLGESKGSNVSDKEVDVCSELEAEALKPSSEAEPSTCIDEDITESLKNETLASLHQLRYFQPPKNEGEYSASDLVWGKIRSHPWWPGQIFDPSDASEKAMKHHKKDCFLIAYFGDGTFAWNDSTFLKPFRADFSQITKKHSNSEAFCNAVNCALEEVSRRVELGLACSCVSREVFDRIKYQAVENGGIRQELSRRFGIDGSSGVSSFEPDKLVDYVRLLAQFPYGEGDKMELVIAKAQLSSYGRYKGYRELPEFRFCGDLSEDVEYKQVEGNPIDCGDVNKNERSLSELKMEDTSCEDVAEGSISSFNIKKRKALDPAPDASEKRPSLNPEQPPTAQTPAAKSSLKIGESVQRAASQLTGPPSQLTGPQSQLTGPPSDDKNGEHADPQPGISLSVQNPENLQIGGNEALAAMLSQLRLAAEDPQEGNGFFSTIVPFFSAHRAAVLSKCRRQDPSTGPPSGGGRKRKPANENENDPEGFEFDDVNDNDSYWTDRIIQNYSEEPVLQDNQNNGGGGEYQLVAFEPEKPAMKPSRRSNKKRFFSSNHEIEAEEQLQVVERRRQNLAAEVVLKFSEGIYFPSEMNLNKMFRRFGPLMESETEVDRQQGRARVVFKRCSDAEVAHSSAGKFKIFGPIDVNYELNYNPLVSYKPLPLPM